jgi:hypothetical protein
MNGYSTGWKFNGWWDIPAIPGSTSAGATVTGIPVSATTGLPFSAPTQSWNGDVYTEPLMRYAVNVHGYNSIRMRFPMTAPVAGALRAPVAWHIYLVESDAEPDQTASMWMMSTFATVMTTWPTQASIPTAYSTLRTMFFNQYGKTWMTLANAVRNVQGHGAVASLTEIPATNPTTLNPAYGYIGNTFAGVLGSYSSLQPHSITAAGVNVADIYSDAAICPTYSPALGVAAQNASAGEIYVNNLGGAQYLLCVPVVAYAYQPVDTKYTAPSTLVDTLAKSVGMMYNLLQ